MSVVMCVKTVGAMARVSAIATVVTLLLVSCRSSREVMQQVDTHTFERRIDTLVTVPGGEARMIADVSVIDGKLTVGSTETSGKGIALSTRIERCGEGQYQLVVDAAMEEREVAVQIHEETTEVRDNRSEDHHHDSSGVPLWVVVGVVAIVLTLTLYVRWMK